MDLCELIRPDMDYEDEIRSFRQEMLDAGSSMDGTGALRRMRDITEWLEFCRIYENPETVPDDWVQSNQFLFVRKTDNRIVGMIQVRRSLNPYLENYGGHIGYSVRPSERRKGYAAKMLADCLELCKTYGLKRVLITCLVDNEGSKRTILANGGCYEGTVYCEKDKEHLERYWVKL